MNRHNDKSLKSAQIWIFNLKNSIAILKILLDISKAIYFLKLCPNFTVLIKNDLYLFFSFPGKIYAPQDPSENKYPEFFLIYDKDNKIAGMHSVVPWEEKLYNGVYSLPTKWYREFPNITDIPKYNGKKVSVTTAYFVDPKLICKDGGAQKGLGDSLLFQNGSSINDFLPVPLKQTVADSDVSFSS